MKRKEKGTEKKRRKPPVFEFGGEVTLNSAFTLDHATISSGPINYLAIYL